MLVDGIWAGLEVSNTARNVGGRWTGMTDRDKVIKGLECCMAEKICDSKCPYKGQCDDGGYYYSRAIEEAIELLKEQEPRVLTLEDLRNIGSVWELNTPPYLCMDINPSYRRIIGSWVAWRNIYELINGLHPTYNADNYGKTWRCWNVRPTDEQRTVKWE